MDSSDRKSETIGAAVKGWIAWAAGSMAAFTATLYVAGYLSMRSHINMLGLDGLVEVSNDELLQEGAKFVVVTGIALAFALLTAAVVLGILVAATFGMRRLAARRIASSARIEAARALIARRGRQLIFALTSVVFLWTVWTDLDELRSALCVTNMLYRAPDTSQCAPEFDRGAKDLIEGLRNASPHALQQHYSDMLTTVVGHAAFLTGLAAWLASGWPLRHWLLAPFVLAMGLMLALLPMDYGVMVRAVRYPRVELTLTDRPAGAVGTPAYLLHANDRGFTVWDSSQRAVVWIPTSAVLRADVRIIENPLAATAGTKGGGT